MTGAEMMEAAGFERNNPIGTRQIFRESWVQPSGGLSVRFRSFDGELMAEIYGGPVSALEARAIAERLEELNMGSE